MYDGEAVFEVNGDDTFTDKAHVGVYLTVKKDAVMTGKVFWPMIRPFEIESDQYVLPAKNNLELSQMACTETTAGTYKLEATVDASGNVTYEWVEVV